MYAKFTDTGINPLEAAKRLNIDWDSAAEIDDTETDDVEVPPAVVGLFIPLDTEASVFSIKLDTTWKTPYTF